MQFFIFMICLLCGVLSGVVYDVLYIARAVVCGVEINKYTIKDKVFLVAADLLYCIIFAAAFIFLSVMFDFYALRLYMLIGCAIGALLYLKSFHIFVAFFVKKVYNSIRKDKEDARDSTKGKQNRRRSNGKRNNSNRHSRCNRHLSNGSNNSDSKDAQRSS